MAGTPKCPNCSGEMSTRVNKTTGIEFLGCTSYPECKGTLSLGCPKCGEPMAKRKNRTNNEDFMGCTKYPACKGTRRIAVPPQNEIHIAPELQKLMNAEDEPF